MANELPIQLHEILSVFARLQVNQSDQVASNSWQAASKHLSRGKHLQTLDGIALLLVTGDKSDVAAVTVSSHPLSNGQLRTVFHVMKNDSCTVKERQYHEQFCRVISDVNMDYETLLNTLCNLVVKNCQKKIKRRATKLQQALQERQSLQDDEINPFGPANGDASITDAMSMFQTWFNLEETEFKAWWKIVIGWLETCLDPKVFTPDVGCGKGSYALIKVCLLTELPALVDGLRSSKVERRIKKLAMYCEALHRVISDVIRHRPTRVFELDILSPPPRISIPIIDSPLRLINRCAPAMWRPMDSFKPEDFQTVNLAGIEDSGVETDQPIGLAYVHCEVALAVLMKDRIPRLMEIGVSKGCCWPCTVFLAAYSGKAKAGANVVVSTSHGKTDLNWLFPTSDVEDTSKVLVTVRQQMKDQVQMVFCRWLQSADNQRRSDLEEDEWALSEEEEYGNAYIDILMKLEGRAKSRQDPAADMGRR